MMGKRSIADLVRDGAILAIQDGNHGEKHPTAADYVERDGVPFVMARDFPNGNLDLRNVTLLNQEVADNLRVGFAKPGDVLLTHKGTVGATGIVPDGFEYVMLTPQVTYYRTDPRRLLNTYLRCAFRAPDFQHQLTSLSAQSTRPFVSISAQRSLTVPVPPVPVQRRIAGILSAYDDLIENCERRIHVLDEMARALYREWFVLFRYPGHEKTPLVESPLGKIPKGWATGSFTDFVDVLSGGTPKTDVAEFWNGEIPFFTPRDAPDCFYVRDTEKHLSALGLSKCASELYPPDTVFITARGTVGKVALPSVPMAMNQSCYALRARGDTSQRFLFLLTLQQVDYLKKNTGGATFATIVVDTFRRMQVVLPPAALIAEFACLVDPMFDTIRNLDSRVANLRTTRDLLLPRLLSGQLSVEEAA